jgi:hypothetical protein
MNNRDNSLNDSNFKKLLNNDNYYRHIFKKTEKIISVVFYILNNVDIDKRSETLVSNIASKAHFAHENALRTLEVKLASSKEVLEQFAQSLVGLDSTLRVASATGFITSEVLSVIVNEIDTVMRGLKTYININTANTDDLLFTQSYPSVYSSEVAPVPQKRERRPVAPSSSEGDKGGAGQSDRRERIKTILEAKKEATIKDISEIITDVSEKTIQRELNAMIEENLVKRQGERRWSRYSIF